MFERGLRAIVAFAVLLTTAVPGWGHDRAYFGYAVDELALPSVKRLLSQEFPGALSSGAGPPAPLYGSLLPASYAGGRFYEESRDVARRFPIGTRVSAVTNLGERTRFVLRRPEPDVHGVSYKLRCVGTCPKGRAVLFWTGNVSLQPQRAVKTKLDSTSLALVRKQAVVLYQRALTHYEFASSTTVQEMQLGTPMSEAVQGVPDIVTVSFPVTLRLTAYGKPDVDSRAWVFFIYSPFRRKILYGTFGHPEWGTMAKDVFLVEPLIYFRISGDPKPYFFGNWSGPWEAGGGGIFDLRTGRKLALEDTSPD